MNECRAYEMVGFLVVMQQSLHYFIICISININIIIIVHIRLPAKMKMETFCIKCALVAICNFTRWWRSKSLHTLHCIEVSETLNVHVLRCCCCWCYSLALLRCLQLIASTWLLYYLLQSHAWNRVQSLLVVSLYECIVNHGHSYTNSGK